MPAVTMIGLRYWLTFNYSRIILSLLIILKSITFIYVNYSAINPSV